LPDGVDYRGLILGNEDTRVLVVWLYMSGQIATLDAMITWHHTAADLAALDYYRTQDWWA
jgi:hypothetical protein